MEKLERSPEEGENKVSVENNNLQSKTPTRMWEQFEKVRKKAEFIDDSFFDNEMISNKLDFVVKTKGRELQINMYHLSDFVKVSAEIIHRPGLISADFFRVNSMARGVHLIQTISMGFEELEVEIH